MNPWILTRDQLPNDRQQVLIYITNTNTWNYYDFNNPENCIPIHMHRATFKRGKIPKRGEPISREDQDGNNRVPYCWEGDGPLSWNGQEVSHWAELPDKPEGE